jgi:hypothetical protein
MKTLILFLGACVILTHLDAQTPPKFNLTKDGISPVVLTFDVSYTASKIYSRVKAWNPSVAKFPMATVRVDNENTQVKFAGHIDEAWNIRDNNVDHWYTLEYVLNIEIKDGRCRVTVETSDTRYKVWYGPNGTIIPKFKNTEDSFEKTINTLLTSLYTGIKDPPKKVEDNW